MNKTNLWHKKVDKVAIIGLGYVGLPMAVAFAKKVDTIGFDINRKKIELYQAGIDITGEIGDEIKESTVSFTYEEERIREANYIIVAVPTPTHSDHTPDLEPLISACKCIGRNLREGTIVIRLEDIIKIVSGMDKETLERVATLYKLIIAAGVHRASSIKVAEAAKIAENSQRDINIAFMNELAIMFDKLSIRTVDVIDAMNTKWNALDFYPGLVGGHCIGVDPYYLIYQVKRLGYESNIVAAGRKMNDEMGKFIAQCIIKELIKANKLVKEAKVYIMGITFKENCPDTRNSKVIDILNELKGYGINVKVVDEVANQDEVRTLYGLELVALKEVREADCLIFAVAHDVFKALNILGLDGMYKEKTQKVLIDVKSIYNKENLERKGYQYWSL